MTDLTEQPPAHRPVRIEEEMRKSYMDYAMSVIVGRALPDIRDGLKPVHRRILYAMLREGILPNKRPSKCAGVVGEVLKRYHPHGDSSVYDALVRMAQGFNLRYPLIIGRGNFGSVDGDPPAAYRYTEARLAPAAMELLSDIDKDTVDFIPNFDGQAKEPTVLPSAMPNLLVNGSAGIAVGMATNIPPHNLGEVCDALLLLLDKPESTIEEVMELVPGPDFPTAGIIYGAAGIDSAYRTGRGVIKIRARSAIEHPKEGRERIIFTEMPYQLNKARCLEKIADLVKEKRLQGISDLRDESSGEGIRVVVDVKRGENAEVVLNQLYSMTPLQGSFGIILLAISQGRPKLFGLIGLLNAFLEHRREVVRRRTAFELREAEARAHILKGLKIALDHLDEVIALIRASRTAEDARNELRERFGLTTIQARAILEMRLQKLTGLEQEKVEEELVEVLEKIGRLRAILADEAKILAIVAEEIANVRKRHADKRRTEIVRDAPDLSIEDLIAPVEMVVTCTRGGYIKRAVASTYRTQTRGGKGRKGMTTREEDVVDHLFVASTHDYVLCFTNFGRVHVLRTYEIPLAGPTGKGRAVVNLLSLAEGERLATLFSVPNFSEERFIMMVSRKGIVKKTPLAEFRFSRQGGKTALTIEEGDELLKVRLTDGRSDIFLASRLGMAIRFPEDQVRSMGRIARGVIGIKLRDGDELVGMTILPQDAEGGTILTVTTGGYGKRTPHAEYRRQRRGGYGTINIKLSAKRGLAVVGIKYVEEGDELFLISASGMILRTVVDQVPCHSRGTKGVKMLSLKEDDEVVAITRVDGSTEEEPEPDPDPSA